MKRQYGPDFLLVVGRNLQKQSVWDESVRVGLGSRLRFAKRQQRRPDLYGVAGGDMNDGHESVALG